MSCEEVKKITVYQSDTDELAVFFDNYLLDNTVGVTVKKREVYMP